MQTERYTKTPSQPVSVELPAHTPESVGKGKPFKYLKISGDDDGIGFEIGCRTRAEIRFLWENWAVPHMQEWFGTSADQYSDTAKWLTDNLAVLAPWMLQQIEGLANGADMDLRHMMLLNHYAVLWPARGLFCTSVALKQANEGPMLFQNLDLGEDDLYFVSDIQPRQGYRILSDGMYGMCWAPTGVNEHGLIVGSSNLSSPDAVPTKPLGYGVPATHLPRLILRNCASVPQAIDFVRTLPAVTPENSGYQLNLIDADGNMAVIDKAGARTVVRQCHEHYNFTTNMSLDPALEAWRMRSSGEVDAVKSQHRTDLIRSAFASLNGTPPSVQWMKELLRSHEGQGRLCKHGDNCNGYSRLSMIYSSRRRSLDISNGPPCTYDYQSFQM